MFGGRDEARWRVDKVVLGGGGRQKVHGAPQNEAARGSARAALGQVSRAGDFDLLLSSASTQDKPSSPAPVARFSGRSAARILHRRSSWSAGSRSSWSAGSVAGTAVTSDARGATSTSTRARFIRVAATCGAAEAEAAAAKAQSRHHTGPGSPLRYARVLLPYRSSWPGRRSPGVGADFAAPLSEDDAAPLSEGVLDAALSRRDAALSRRDAAPALSWRDAAPRWRVLIVLGLVAASGLCIYSGMGILQGEKDNRRVIEVQRSDCRNVRDKITDWGKRLAVEASTSGWLMVRERDLALGPKMPFLVPGVLSAALQVERLERMAEQFEKVPPIVVWYPTVRLEDRAAYEAYASNVSGAPILIMDQRGWQTSESETGTVASPVPAPPRDSYNPATFVWSRADPMAELVVKRQIGFDLQKWFRQILPPALFQRFFGESRLIAHPWYLPSGEPLANFAITVRVPFVDDCQGGKCFFEDGDSVLGVFSFTLRLERWATVFPLNVNVRGAVTGDTIKTEAPGFAKHVYAYEPFLDLDLECYFNHQRGQYLLYAVGVSVTPLVVIALLVLLRHLEREVARERGLVDERRKGDIRDLAVAAKEAVAAEQRKEERLRYGFEVNEKTERYLNHELKNRIFVLGQSCAEQPHVQEQIEEMTEVLNSKAVLMRLTTGRYKPSLEAVRPTALIAVRWQRFAAANSPFDRAEPTGAAANRTSLCLDKVLFNIILDNILSNAFKYGDASKPPALSLNVEPLDSEASRVRLTLELRNCAGPEHASLLQMGEDELNKIALAEGRRAHVHAAELSAGDGFSMAGVAARTLGGTIRLVLLPDGVVAKLELPNVVVELPDVVVAPCPGEARILVETARQLSRLKVAMVDDSASFRKTFARLAETVTSRVPFVAGATRESIDDFPKSVVESDVDIVFLDFNYAPVHHTKTGIDLCRECRERDAEEGNAPRLIFIVSANDSPEDTERYRAAGADGSLGKKMTVLKLRKVFEDALWTHPRFAASRPVNASDLAVVEDVLRSDATPMPSPPPLEGEGPAP